MKARSALRQSLSKTVPAVVTFAGAVLLWQALCVWLAIPDYILPSPKDIGQAFTQVSAQRWWIHLWATTKVALLGFTLAFVIALPLAVGLVRSRYLQQTLYPFLVMIQSTPVVAIAPLLMVILGSGDLPRIIITCLISFFPLVVAMTTGMLATPHELLELSRALGAPGYREYTQIRLPFAVPHIFGGLKVAITLAIVGAVVAEFVAAENGLGYFIQFSTSFFKVPQAFAALTLLILLSLTLFHLVGATQRWLFRWSLPHD